jgi:hypothetical protein
MWSTHKSPPHVTAFSQINPIPLNKSHVMEILFFEDQARNALFKDPVRTAL